MTRPLVFDLPGRHLTIQLADETVAGLPSSLQAFWLELGEWRPLAAHELARLQVTIGVEVVCSWCDKGHDFTVRAPCSRCSGTGRRFDPMRAAVSRGPVVMAARLLEPREAGRVFWKHGNPWRSGVGSEPTFIEGRSGEGPLTYEDRERRDRVSKHCRPGTKGGAS